LFGQTLDLNVADVAALEVLPRIGPRRAAAIVATRKQERFASIDDLARVPGIGPRIIAGFAGWASVEGKP
jgi:competence protein ComEA